MEWVESTGETIEQAKDRALDRLGVHSDDAEFEVVSDVKTGLFGRIKEEARVRARVAPATPRGKEDRKRGRGRGKGSGSGGGRGNKQGKQGSDKQGSDKQSSAKQGGSSKPDNRNSDNRKSDNRNGNKKGRKEMTMSDEDMMPLPEQADLAEEFVGGLAERFGTAVTFDRQDIEEDEIRITVSGDNLGRMIGRRGTTAGAIDELVRTVLQRQAGSARNGRIRVDVGGVRAKRAEALARFAQAQAAEVRDSGSARSLEPMSAADRKVVHDALTDEAGVDTISEGEDSQRRVVIVLAD